MGGIVKRLVVFTVLLAVTPGPAATALVRTAPATTTAAAGAELTALTDRDMASVAAGDENWLDALCSLDSVTAYLGWEFAAEYVSFACMLYATYTLTSWVFEGLDALITPAWNSVIDSLAGDISSAFSHATVYCADGQPLVTSCSQVFTFQMTVYGSVSGDSCDLDPDSCLLLYS